ncbi:FAD-binding oxidoreductase [Legionella sp. WA2022007384]
MDWNTLRNHISGTVITKNDANFPSIKASMVWNGLKPDRSPEVIVIVKNDDDVVTAINFAQKNGLRVVVHGGGHTWCGLAVRHGGMVIDLSELNESKIDKLSQKAVIQPVISNRELARRLAAYDLAFPIGHCPTVKASGYLLNGGMSWNLSDWGPACLSVEAIELVTANGQKVIASSSEHSDLFWAARGCGPGMFAVATRFHLKCYPLPKTIMTSNYYYSLDQLKEVVEEVTTLGWTMPRCVELSIFLIQAPSELIDQCKTTNEKVCMITAVAFAHNQKEGLDALKILEQGSMAKKCLAKKLNEPSSFESLSEISGITWPEHHRNLCENQCSKAKPVDILMALRDKIIDAPSRKSVIVFCQSTGQHNLLEAHTEVALSMEGQSYGGCWAIWEKPEDDAANIKWQNEVCAILKKFTNTHYIGETDIVQDPTRIQNSYTSAKWKKLEKIRAKYDPQGLFFGYLGGI